MKFKNILKLKIASNSVESVYSSHLLEHLFRSDTESLLRKIYIGLQDGGVIRLALPDYDAFIARFNQTHQQDPLRANQEFEAALLSHPSQRPAFILTIWHRLSGNLHIHRWHPNYAVLEQMMKEIGFQNIERKNFQESNLDGIQFLENRNELTFYIEAVK